MINNELRSLLNEFQEFKQIQSQLNPIEQKARLLELQRRFNAVLSYQTELNSYSFAIKDLIASV